MNILEFVEIDSASICSMVPINSRKKNKTHKRHVHIKQLQNQKPPKTTQHKECFRPGSRSH